MPIYEYECRKCGAVFEELETACCGEAAPVKCPECGAAETRRIVSCFSSGRGGEQGAGGGGGGGGCGGGGGWAGWGRGGRFT